jgi:hypothetical protein
MLCRWVRWDRYGEHVVWVECYADIVAHCALNFRFQLTIKQINKDTPFALHKTIPKVLRHYLIRSAIRIFLFNIRLLANLIAVLMHSL